MDTSTWSDMDEWLHTTCKFLNSQKEEQKKGACSSTGFGQKENPSDHVDVSQLQRSVI